MFKWRRSLKETAAPESIAETPGSIADTAQFVERELRAESGYRFAAGCPETLLATCVGLLAHELFGGFSHLSEDQRRRLGAHLLTYQSATTGLFRDPAHHDGVLFRLQKFTPLYIEWQETYFALHALDALGLEPRYPLAFIEPFLDERLLDPWLRGLGFDDFWFSSNYLMFLVYFLIEYEGIESRTAHRVLDVLDGRQDPKTGFWGTDQGASLFNGMAGAYHLYGFYQFLGRPISHQTAALQSTLTLQEKSGLFGGPGGGPCEDLDAIDILVKLEPGSSAQERSVQRALERALSGLRSCRLPSGGYSWWPARAELPHRIVTYSNLPDMQTRTDAGDIWSAWFRPLAIALIQERLGVARDWKACFRRLPLLGWHPVAQASP
jgi:hypothetical protein